MSVQKYTRVVTEPVEAIQFSGDNWAEIMDWIGFDGDFFKIAEQDRLNSDDPEATADLYVAANSVFVGVTPTEWIIRDQHGFYPCKADVFATNYEPAGETR